jgi:FkbM family methyltransferase
MTFFPALVDRILNWPPVLRLCLRWRIGGIARVIRAAAAAAGVTLVWQWRSVTVRHGNDEIIFANHHRYHLLRLLRHLEAFKRRLHFDAHDGRRRSDCRGVQCIRLWHSEDFIRSPIFPEICDPAAGYFLHGVPPPGAVVFDVGAFVGEMTVPLARFVGPTGRVYAFEPDAESRRWLARNLQHAGVHNVTIVDKGLWHESTIAPFMAGAKDGSKLLCLANATDPSLPIAMLSFEDACRLAGRAPDFVKMDIEGAEVEVIGAAIGLIRRHPIRFAIASYHPRDGQPASRLLEPMFRDAGYQVETGYPKHQTTWAWPKSHDA